MTVLRRLIVTVLLLAAAAAQGRTIAVIGTGDVGSVLGRRWSEAGHTVIYGSRAPASARVRALLEATGPDARADTPAAAAAAAEVVVLAVPFHAVEALLPTLGDLGRRIVIDCTSNEKMTTPKVMASNCCFAAKPICDETPSTSAKLTAPRSPPQTITWR